jgi:HSP20 family protein
VKVELEEGLFLIHVEKDEKKYHTKVLINIDLDADSSKASYKSGILELKINLKKASQFRVRKVRVQKVYLIELLLFFFYWYRAVNLNE